MAPSICEPFGLLTQFPPLREKNVAFQKCFFNAVRRERWSAYSHTASTSWLLIYELDQAVVCLCVKATVFCFFWGFFSVYAQLWQHTSMHMWFSPNGVAAAIAVPSFPLLLWKWIPGNPWIPRLHVPTCPALCLNCRFFTQTHGALLARAHGRTSPGGLILRFGDKIFTLSWLQNNWSQTPGGSENSWRAARGLLEETNSAGNEGIWSKIRAWLSVSCVESCSALDYQWTHDYW